MSTNLFQTVEEALCKSSQVRTKIDPKLVPKYYFPYLDDVLFGIAPAELVVIGADTGQGKSWLANNLAINNAKHGRKSYLFSLEGHRNEVINRIKWGIILREYYKNPTYKDMTYAKYEMNMIEGLEEFEKIAEEEIKDMVGDKLMLFDKSQSLNINILTQQLGLIADAELVVIDHLHYFDMVDDTNEAQHLSEILKRVKFITEERNIPVVMISHLRKKHGQRGLPDNEDFMGTSNIPKIATTCIILSSNPEKHNLADGKYSTIVRVTKSRAGASTTLAAELTFDSKLQTYEENFSLGKVLSGSYKDLREDEQPYWAKAKNNKTFWSDDD